MLPGIKVGARGGRRSSVASSATSKADDSEESEDEEGKAKHIDSAVEYVTRFRKSLVSHFGSEEDTFAALDLNGDGAICFSEFMAFFEREEIFQNLPKDEGGDEEIMDARKLFNMMDLEGTGFMSCFELTSCTDDELRAKLSQGAKKRRSVEQAAPPSEVCPTNIVERFRRMLLKRWPSLDEAFAALDSNGKGELSLGEINGALTSLQILTQDELGLIDVKLAFQAMDADKSGEVSAVEFNGTWRGQKTKKSAKDKKAKKGVAKKKGKSKGESDDEMENLNLMIAMKSRSRRQGLALRRTSNVQSTPDGQRGPGSSNVMRLIEEFAMDVTIHTLNLNFGCVGDWGAERLSLALPAPGRVGMRFIEVLQLDGNYIGDAGLTRLTAALEQHCAVQKLTLARNGISNDGAQALSSLICKVSALTHLCAAQNYIGDEGASFFAKALKKKPKPALRTLDLQDNEIGVVGIDKLRGADHPQLKMELQGNAGVSVPKSDVDVSGVLGALWGSDVACPPKRPPSKCTVQVAWGCEEDSLPVAMASQMSSEVGDSWAPSSTLMRHLLLARDVGLGKALARPRSEVSLRQVKDDRRPSLPRLEKMGRTF